MSDRKPMPKMVDRKCKCCGTSFQARAVDVKRGWGRYCSKSCKAIRQESRTGQYRRYQQRQSGISRDDGAFAMSPAELACGGYGDADENSPFGEGKW
jgi:hypothetical protein